ncbi:MAG: DMT family transporter [Bacteroidales bacterium]|nr:DMT family transporter [Bacteroidales bacterium]
MDNQHKRMLGFCAGIIAGISYGTNPLFAIPLQESGIPTMVMLLFRYGISALLMAVWMLARRESFRVAGKELGILLLLGLLFAASSLALFASYHYIASGLATTLVYLYPVFVALIMVLLKVHPSWQTWLSIGATFIGILLLSEPADGARVSLPGILLAVASALSYAFYIVLVNRSRRIKGVSEHALTFYALLTGTVLFCVIRLRQGGNFLEGVDSGTDWLNLLGLALVPTMMAMLSLAISTRYIGPTKTSILGVFEPLTAILIGTILFGEPLTTQMVTGIAICITAVTFMVVKPQVGRRHPGGFPAGTPA